jgi:hypothetical protein
MSSGLLGGDSAMKSPSFPQYVHRLGLVLHRCCTPLSTAKSLTYPRRAPPPGLQAGASQWAVHAGRWRVMPADQARPVCGLQGLILS